jgi:hypothetical protein
MKQPFFGKLGNGGALMIRTGKNKILSVIMVAALVLTILPLWAVPAFAAETLVWAASKPGIQKGKTNQAAGDISFREDTNTVDHWGTGVKTVNLTLPNGINFTYKPTVTAAPGSSTVIESVLLTANNVLEIQISGDNTSRDGFDITNISYDVPAGAPKGDVNVAIGGDLPDTPGSVANAEIVPGATAQALSVETVAIGQNKQLAGDIAITESDTNTISAGKTITLTILTPGVTFFQSPIAVVSGSATFQLESAVDGSAGGTNIASWTVLNGSTDVTATVTFDQIFYNVASSVTPGDIEVGISISSNPVPVDPSQVVNATAAVGGVNITALSQPTIAQNAVNQAAGDISVIENSPGVIETGTIAVAIATPGVTFAIAPMVVTDTVSGLALDKQEGTLNTNFDTATWHVTGVTTQTVGTLEFSNFVFNTIGADPGPVQLVVSLPGVGDSFISNAYIGAQAKAQAQAVSKPDLLLGVANQRAGNISITESAAGAIQAGGQSIQLNILEAWPGASGIFFTGNPVARVTSGDLVLGSVALDPIDNVITIDVVQQSTVPSTIEISDIFYDVSGGATTGNVLVEVWVDPDGLVKIGTVANGRVLTAEEGPFSDVSSTHYASEAITYLKNNGIVSGYPDGSYQPNNPVSRAEFAKMAVEAAGLTLIDPATPSFNDVPKSHWAYKYIETAKANGIIEGYPDGSFRPNNNITRAEIAAVIVRAAGLSIDTSGTAFTDVPDTHWAYDEIMTAKNNGIVSGYPDGTFRPDNSATRAEAAQMVYNWLTM